MATHDELADRAYGEGGPKHGVRRRRDAIETLATGYRYLHIRAAREDSSDYAATAEQTIEGLTFELSRRSAKAWDPTLGQKLAGSARRELLVHHRGRAMAKLLDELAGCGLLVWGGERDNNGLWWRLRIRLLDPDEPQPMLEPWVRTAHLSASQGGGEAHNGNSQCPATGTVDFRALQDAAAAAGASRMLAPAEADRLRASLRRFNRNVEHRPRGVAAEPMAVLLAQLQVLRGPSALVRALAAFHELTRHMERAAKHAPGGSSSQNCAAPLEQQRQQQQNRTNTQEQSVACPRGAHATRGIHDATTPPTEIAPPAESQSSDGGQDQPPPIDMEALLQRVAEREAHLKNLSEPRRWRLEESVARALCWPGSAPVPMGLLGEACKAITGRRPWLQPSQLDRLRRAERRYAHYATHRPQQAPPTPAGALLALVEHAPDAVRARLPWAIAQLDLLSKRMRRTARHTTETERLPNARKRAYRRLNAPQRRSSTGFFRAAKRPNAKLLEATVAQLAHELWADPHPAPPGQAVAPTLPGGDLTGHLRILVDHLLEHGIGTTPEQLRTQLRDKLLLTGAPVHAIGHVEGTSHSAPTPAVFDPSTSQLASHERAEASLR